MRECYSGCCEVMDLAMLSEHLGPQTLSLGRWFFVWKFNFNLAAIDSEEPIVRISLNAIVMAQADGQWLSGCRNI